jgi:hypothetical protein
LQMRFRLSDVTRRTQIIRSHTLGNGPFHSCALFVELFEFVRLPL